MMCTPSFANTICPLRWLGSALKLELQRLKSTTYLYTSGHRDMAKKEWYRGDERSARKALIHALRFLLWAKDIAKTRRPFVEDFAAGNEYYRAVFDPSGPAYPSPSSSLPDKAAQLLDSKQRWRVLDAWYSPIFERHMEEFRRYTNVYKAISAEFEQDVKSQWTQGVTPRPFAILEYLKHRHKFSDYFPTSSSEGSEPLAFLREELSITAIPISGHPHLLQLNHDGRASPVNESIVAQECCGLVLKRSARSPQGESLHPEETTWVYEIACFPQTKVASYSGAEREIPLLPLDGFDWENARVIEAPLGITVNLFYTGSAWTVSATYNNYFAYSLRERVARAMEDKAQAEAEAGQGKGKQHQLLTHAEWVQRIEHVFWMVWHHLGYELPSNAKCFTFRLVVAELSIFIDSNNSNNNNDLGDLHTTVPGRLILVAVRDQLTYTEELPQPYAAEYHWEAARERPELAAKYLAQSKNKQPAQVDIVWVKKALRGLIEESRDLSLIDYSGFFVCDPSFKRIKLPSPQYQVLASLQPYTNRYNKRPMFLSIVRSVYTERERFCRYYPEWAEWFTYVCDTLTAFCDQVDQVQRTRLAHLPDREFALEIKALEREANRQARDLEKQLSALFTKPHSPITNMSLGKLYWALRKQHQFLVYRSAHDAVAGVTAVDARQQPYLEALTYLLSHVALRDDALNKRLEGWLWKVDNSKSIQLYKCVRQRHATHHPFLLNNHSNAGDTANH
eukprot:TRINITY_DN7401_c0_g1_i1.p1 TRINITY_DN7401_c0_g1~~TRINITY_DN7401_c0_g1_i1.p1  ORF type:complete len:735 (+),score=111.59 TRINITY_DN7401_c0_g1_i1:360-2564(+)